MATERTGASPGSGTSADDDQIGTWAGDAVVRVRAFLVVVLGLITFWFGQGVHIYLKCSRTAYPHQRGECLGAAYLFMVPTGIFGALTLWTIVSAFRDSQARRRRRGVLAD